VILSGGYWEHVPKDITNSSLDQGIMKIWRPPGYFNICNTDYKHRIILGKEKPWTIFIPFKRVTEWGFWIPIIWREGLPCIPGTTVNNKYLNNTKWIRVPHEKYIREKYSNTENEAITKR
jgi:hypothetical protein